MFTRMRAAPSFNSLLHVSLSATIDILLGGLWAVQAQEALISVTLLSPSKLPYPCAQACSNL